MRKLLVASLLMMMPLAAFSANKIEGYYVPTTSLDDGTDDEDGDGFGLRGEFNVAKNWLLEGEWQTATYDFGVDVDLSDLRLGGGFTTEGPIRFAAIAEYVRWNIDADIAGADDATADGFGVQGGCRATSTR